MKALAVTLAVVLSSMLSCEPDDVTCQECYMEYYELNKDTQEFEYQGEYECKVDQIGIMASEESLR